MNPTQQELDDELVCLEKALAFNQKLREEVSRKRQCNLEKLDQLDQEIYLEGFGYFSDEDENIREDNLIKNESFNTGLLRDSKGRLKSPLEAFFIPYIRDSKDFSAPNLFSADREFTVNTRMLSTITHPKIPRGWTAKEDEQIVTQVRTQHLAKTCDALVRRIESLLALPEKTANVSEEVNRLNSELVMVKSKQLEPPRSELESLDWLSIAKYLPEDRTAEDAEMHYSNWQHSQVNKSEWSAQEEVKLAELAQLYPCDWDRVANELGTGRVAWQCCAKFQKTLNVPHRRTGPIVGEEAEELVQLIQHYESQNNVIQWKKVASLYEGRSISQIKHFWEKRQNPTNRGPWSSEEEQMVLACYKLYGTKWSSISKFVPNRNKHQIREHYNNVLCFLGRTALERKKLGNWTTPEDELILEMSTKYHKPDGSINFPEIQRLYFPNRNVKQLYRRYFYLQKNLPDIILENMEQSVNRDVLREKTITRKLRLNNRKRPSIPDDPDELKKFIAKLWKALISHSSDEACPALPEISSSSPRENRARDDAENSDKTPLDACFELYVQLEPVWRFFKRRYVYDAKADLRTNYLMETSILEMIDPTVDVSLLPLGMDPLQRSMMEPSLDIFRFYLSQTSIYLDSEVDISDDQTIRSLTLPNIATMFGYSLLQLLMNAMLFKLAEDSGFECNDYKVKSAPEFGQLLGIFQSIFLWPALLSTSDDLEIGELNPEVEVVNSEIEELNIPDAEPKKKKKSVGRPRKRVRRESNELDRMLRSRSLSNSLLFSRISYDMVSGLDSVHHSNFWINDSSSQLALRVFHFLRHTESMVNSTYQEKRIASEGSSQVESVKTPRVPRRGEKRLDLPIANTRRSSRQVHTDSRDNQDAPQLLTTLTTTNHNSPSLT